MLRILAALLPCLLLLSGCYGVPDCDSSRAEELMESHVYTIIARAFDEKSPDAALRTFRDALQVSPRDEAIVNAYAPYLPIAHDTKWLFPRLYAQIPDGLKHIGVESHLKVGKFRELRRAIKVRLSDHEPLPDRTEGGRTYTKVCRAKLWIESTSAAVPKTEPITLVYSANSPPRTSVPMHIGINFFEASEAPLPFTLSDREKIELMVRGATRDMEAQPLPQQPLSRIQRVGLRTLRQHMQASEAAAASRNGTAPAARSGNS